MLDILRTGATNPWHPPFSEIYFLYFVEKRLTFKQFQVFASLFTLCRETHRTTLNYSVFIYLWFFSLQRRYKEIWYSLSLLNLESVSLVKKNIKLKDFRVVTWEFLCFFFPFVWPNTDIVIFSVVDTQMLALSKAEISSFASGTTSDWNLAFVCQSSATIFGVNMKCISQLILMRNIFFSLLWGEGPYICASWDSCSGTSYADPVFIHIRSRISSGL